LQAKYINPYTDFGFKKLFGEEANKDLLADFLNQLLPAKHKIVELTFKNSEQLGTLKMERKAIFDIHCKNEKGDRFIVEMQKAKLKFFKDRAVFYMTFPIREQAEKGEWNFSLNPVYCVALLDFEFDDEREKKDYHSQVQLKDQYCRTFFDKLSFHFIEMPRFTKKLEELENHFEKWLYFLKYLEDFDTIPDILKEEVFLKGFKVAKLANLSKKELAKYENSLKVYRDLKGVIDTSFEEGLEQGITQGIEQGITQGIEQGVEQEKVQVAKNALQAGLPMAMIEILTGFTKERIEKIK